MSTSCLIYLNGPAAALGVLRATAISGLTSTSGERRDKDDTGHQPLYLYSSQSRDGRAVICGFERPRPPVPSNSLQEGKQVLRSDLIQRTQALSKEMLEVWVKKKFFGSDRSPRRGNLVRV